MFEEIPRPRRGLGRLTGRRFVVGPFVIGGGLVLTMLGGSVAVAGSVITASAIGLHGPSSSRPQAARSVVVAPSAARHHTLADGELGAATSPVTAGLLPPLVGLSSAPVSSATNGSAARSGPASTGSPALLPTMAPATPSSAVPAATAATSEPAGNALVYITGYDAASSAFRFRYASLVPNAGPGGAEVYVVGGATVYRAPLSASASIVSGSTLCPPAGNRCSSAQLVAAAPAGLYAEVAIDSAGSLQSVIERGDPATDVAPDVAMPTRRPSADPKPTPTPTQPAAAPQTAKSPVATGAPNGAAPAASDPAPGASPIG
jgi:hypothetical protein